MHTTSIGACEVLAFSARGAETQTVAPDLRATLAVSGSPQESERELNRLHAQGAAPGARRVERLATTRTVPLAALDTRQGRERDAQPPGPAPLGDLATEGRDPGRNLWPEVVLGVVNVRGEVGVAGRSGALRARRGLATRSRPPASWASARRRA